MLFPTETGRGHGPDDRQLLHLLSNEINSFERWDVLRFFLETGAEHAPMDEIARAVGRESAALIAPLGALTSLGWVARRTLEGGTLYSLTRETERRAQLEQLHAAMEDRDFCVRAMGRWLVEG